MSADRLVIQNAFRNKDILGSRIAVVAQPQPSVRPNQHRCRGPNQRIHVNGFTWITLGSSKENTFCSASILFPSGSITASARYHRNPAQSVRSPWHAKNVSE